MRRLQLYQVLLVNINIALCVAVERRHLNAVIYDVDASLNKNSMLENCWK